jgi:hypothetical protein
VVLLDEPTGWVAFFSTDPSVAVAEILTTVADRFSLETAFRDYCKEVVGAGQQQVRFVGASIGTFHVCLWTFTMTEAWAWGREEEELVDRSASPWDDTSRRPAMRISVGRGGWSCCARRYGRFYGLGRPGRKFKLPPIGCSAWLHSMHEIAERTGLSYGGPIRKGRWRALFRVLHVDMGSECDENWTWKTRIGEFKD